MRNFICFIAVVLLMWHLAHRDHLDIGWKLEGFPTPNALATDDPVQGTVPLLAIAPWVKHGFSFRALATYAITARVLHASPYSQDSWSEICPLDLALGWGRMSDPRIYQQFDITQYDRHYIWRYTGEPAIPEEEISQHSANTHMIPANDAVRDTLFTFQRNDVVRLTGYLVHIDLPDGSQINSSLTRNDVGDGACEVMWVQQAEKVGR